MGAWGADSLENDTACDWAYGLQESSDLSLVKQAFEQVLNADEYLDSDEACEAIAACEVLARLKNNAGQTDAYSEAIDTWVKNHPQEVEAGLIRTANLVLDRIVAEDSELNELWKESDSYSEWTNNIKSLRTRLGQ